MNLLSITSREKVANQYMSGITMDLGLRRYYNDDAKIRYQTSKQADKGQISKLKRQES